MIKVSLKWGGKQCIGRATKDRKCNKVKCPEDCIWDVWSQWTDCSTTCNVGQIMRDRKVWREERYGGKACQGQAADDMVCNIQTCPEPVDCSFGPWSDWSACSGKRPHTGERWRLRVKNLEAHDGRPCDGPLSIIEQCFPPPKPVAANITNTTISKQSANMSNATIVPEKRQRPAIPAVTTPPPKLMSVIANITGHLLVTVNHPENFSTDLNLKIPLITVIGSLFDVNKSLVDVAVSVKDHSSTATQKPGSPAMQGLTGDVDIWFMVDFSGARDLNRFRHAKMNITKKFQGQNITESVDRIERQIEIPPSDNQVAAIVEKWNADPVALGLRVRHVLQEAGNLGNYTVVKADSLSGAVTHRLIVGPAPEAPTPAPAPETTTPRVEVQSAETPVVAKSEEGSASPTPAPTPSAAQRKVAWIAGSVFIAVAAMVT